MHQDVFFNWQFWPLILFGLLFGTALHYTDSSHLLPLVNSRGKTICQYSSGFGLNTQCQVIAEIMMSVLEIITTSCYIIND